MSTRSAVIRTALRTHLMVIADLPPVNWQGQPFTPPAPEGREEALYIRETLMQNTEILSANGERTATGIYQLDVFMPTGLPVRLGEDLADDIKEHFKPAQILAGIKLEKSSILQMIPETVWSIIPVRVEYRTHQTNI